MVRPPLLSSLLAGACCALAVLTARAAEPEGLNQQLRGLAEQNHRLQEQVEAQQQRIDALAAKLEAIERKEERQEKRLDEWRERPTQEPAERPREMAVSGGAAGVRLSGEVGLAFFHTGRAGEFPNSEFRVDDARFFLEAPVAKNTYFFAQLDVRTRESDDAFALGEFYVDFEDVSGRFGGATPWLNVRAGQINIPFGEEYLVRGPVANPLISHSLADVWGYDPGIEAYGSVGAWQYAIAVQNGGINPLRDFNADKAVTARLGWTPRPWLQLSASAARTGELKVGNPTATGDFLSALWFGNGFFRANSPTNTARTFWVNLWEGDAKVHWKDGQVSAAFGGVHYADNDGVSDNTRRLRYGFLEAVQALGGNFHGAARYSAIRAPKGYPLAGWGNAGRYFFAPAPAEALQRLSLGFGYRFGPPLVLKFEYAWEWGRQLSGAARDQEDFFGAEIGLTF